MVAVTTGGVSVGKSVGVDDVVGTETSVSVREEAYVATASVRTASASVLLAWLELFAPHEKIKTPNSSIKIIERIFVFIG